MIHVNHLQETSGSPNVSKREWALQRVLVVSFANIQDYGVHENICMKHLNDQP